MKIKYIFGFLLLSIVSMGAENRIKGIVMEVENPDQPIVGANIYWQNTTQGTTTNANGEFEIAKPEDAHMLVFSFVGYNTEVVHISGNKFLKIQLEKNLELGEVLIQKRQQGQ